MAKDTVKKRVEINDIRDPYFCVWLQEMAEKGFLYKRKDIFTCVFEKASPQKRRYRVLERKWRKMGEEEKALYHEAGWSAVASYNGVTVFTTADPDAPELFSDEDSHLRMLRNKKMESAIVIVLGILLILSRIRQTVGTGFRIYDKEFIYQMGRLNALEYAFNPVWITFSGVVFDIAILIMWIMLVINEIRFLKLYSGKESFEYDIPYTDIRYVKLKGRVRSNQLLIKVFLLLILAPMIIGIIRLGGSFNEGEKALTYNESHPVMMREFDSANWDKAKPLIQQSRDRGEEIDYYAEKRRGGLILKETYEEQLNTYTDDGNGKELISYWSKYIVVRDEYKAEEYLGENIAFHMNDAVGGDEKWKEALEKVRIECEDVDYAGYYTNLESFENGMAQNQILYLKKGADIQEIQYVGPIDLRDKIDLFVKEFEED